MRLVIAGATGRMGQALIRLLPTEPEFKLVGAVARPAEGSVGNVPVVERLSDALAQGADVVIDFTHASAVEAHAEAVERTQTPWVLGTTGLSDAGQLAVERAATKIPVVMAPNLSVGVNLMFALAAQLSQALGAGYDAEIVETHHRMKRDAPSGTALRLAERIAQARRLPPQAIRLSREGQVGERPAAEVGVQSLRGGDVVGDHTVFFFGEGERIELTHRATSRDGFAKGAFRAARFVSGRKPGLYDMSDVLGLR